MPIIDSRTRNVLRLIAIDNNVDAKAVFIQGDIVFYRENGDLRSACNVGSMYWKEVESHVLAQEAIANAMRRQ